MSGSRYLARQAELPRPIAWRALSVAFVAFLTMLSLTCCSPTRTFEAIHLLRDIAAGEEPSTLKNRTAEPDRRTITYAVDGRRYVGDVYRPGAGQAKAAAVFVPGVVERGKDDPRIVAFAKSFARSGFLVLVPDIPNLRALVISASDSRAVADAVRHLAAPGERDDEQTVGLFAFSYAAGPALIAASDPETRHLLRFIYVVGPYYNIEAVVTYFTTGHYRRSPDEPWSTGEASPYARWVFLRSNADRVEDPRDRTALIAIAARKLADADADVSDLTPGLGPEGASIYTLLTNHDPDRVHGLIARLPAAVRKEMEALDLRWRDLSMITARLVILHGRTDPMIPFTESIALAQAAKATSDLYVLDSLSHVDLELSGLNDLYKLWTVAYIILAERDSMPPPHNIEDEADLHWQEY